MVGDIESALRELGINYKLNGDEAIARCPSHNDRHPSWSCNTHTGVHHCFSCGFGGNFASLVAYLLDLSYPAAAIWCNEKIGWARAHQWQEQIRQKNKLPADFNGVAEADLYAFGIPPAEKLRERGVSLVSGDKYEILWDKKEEAWIFPVRHPFTGELWGWQSKNARHFRNYPQGLQRSETLFGLGNVPDGSTIVLVESPIDCAYLLSAGISGGVSSYGVHVSNRQFSLIQSRTESLVVALDNDSAGVAETARICEEAGRLGTVRVFNYGKLDAKDPGELTPEQLVHGYMTAWSALKWMNVYRKFRQLSEDTSEAVLRPWKLINSLYDGSWQDTYRIGRSGKFIRRQED